MPARPVTVVTGGSRGIGAATVLRLAGDGHDVAVGYRHGADEARTRTSTTQRPRRASTRSWSGWPRSWPRTACESTPSRPGWSGPASTSDEVAGAGAVAWLPGPQASSCTGAVLCVAGGLQAVFVLVTGPPAAGKTRLSTALAHELGLPRLAKDTLKRGLLEVLGADHLDDTRRIAAAAVRGLLALASEQRVAVLDSVWVASDSVERLRALPGPVVEVFCACPLPLLRRRYRARAEQRSGRTADFDLERPETELWNARSLRPLAGGWPVVTVDTGVDVDVPALARAVRRAVEQPGATPPVRLRR